MNSNSQQDQQNFKFKCVSNVKNRKINNSVAAARLHRYLLNGNNFGLIKIVTAFDLSLNEKSEFEKYLKQHVDASFLNLELKNL